MIKVFTGSDVIVFLWGGNTRRIARRNAGLVFELELDFVGEKV